jgi:transmembrane sensor
MKPSAPEPEPFSGAIETAAIEWLLEREEGFKPGRAQAFAAWCAADARHAAAMTRAAYMMNLLAQSPAMPNAWPEFNTPSNRQTRNGRAAVFSRGVWMAGLAAALACALTLGWLIKRDVAPEELYLVTEITAPQQMALSDGSVVDVNANSRLQVRLMPQERRIELKEGEAHFEVAHDPNRPFVVNAGGISVHAVGTAFNVRIGETGVEVLVTEGKVKIARLADGSLADQKDSIPLVGASERVWAPRDRGLTGVVISKVDADFITQALAWHSTVTNFSNRSLREIVSWFNRQNSMQLVLADAELGELRIGGAFASDQPAAFAELMEQGGEIVREKRGEHEILLRRAR